MLIIKLIENKSQINAMSWNFWAVTFSTCYYINDKLSNILTYSFLTMIDFSIDKGVRDIILFKWYLWTISNLLKTKTKQKRKSQNHLGRIISMCTTYWDHQDPGSMLGGCSPFPGTGEAGRLGVTSLISLLSRYWKKK